MLDRLGRLKEIKRLEAKDEAEKLKMGLFPKKIYNFFAPILFLSYCFCDTNKISQKNKHIFWENKPIEANKVKKLKLKRKVRLRGWRAKKSVRLQRLKRQKSLKG
jgi:hypothetical protein